MTITTEPRKRITAKKDFRHHAPMNIRQAIYLLAGVIRRIEAKNRNQTALHGESRML